VENKNIYTKLFEAKKEIGKISKDSTNPFFKSGYLSLNGLIDAVEEVLVKHNLLLLQPIEDGKVRSEIINIDAKETESFHVFSEMELPQLTDPQKLGSAITYYRRYTLQSLLGLQAEDDDANLASKATTQQPDNDLPWLKDADIQKVIEHAQTKGLKASDLRHHYKISKANFAKLESEL